MNLKLIIPNKKHSDLVIDYLNDFKNNNEEPLNFNNFTDYNTWLNKINLRSNKNTLPIDRVLTTTFFVINNNEIIGITDLKHEFNNEVLNYTGQISYAVRPSKRHNNYGTEILKLILIYAKENNFSKVLITCDEDNVDSSKIIEKNNGDLENIIYNSLENKNIKRYWIYL